MTQIEYHGFLDNKDKMIHLFNSFTADKPMHDGIKVDIALNDVDGKPIVTLPNYLWTQETITKSLLTAGFCDIEWIEENYSETIDKNLEPWAMEARKDLGIYGYFRAYKKYVTPRG